MNLLSLDTSTLRGAIAIRRGDGSRFCSTTDPARRHGRDLIPQIRELLHEAGLRPAELTAIGVGLGPGSYTGLRVGVMAAKTLAYATGASLVGLDSLEFFARAASITEPRITVLSDAQRGDFHVADFRRETSGGSLRRVREIRIESPVALIESWTESRLVIGPGLAKWAGDWPDSVVPSEIADNPDPSLLLDMLDDLIASGPPPMSWTLEPIYLRRSAAEDLWEKRR